MGSFFCYLLFFCTSCIVIWDLGHSGLMAFGRLENVKRLAYSERKLAGLEASRGALRRFRISGRSWVDLELLS